MVKENIELWGGIECTHNRVGENYFDQLERNGHERRIEDLELFAGLGIRALRYPVLWERVAPLGTENIDWSAYDRRLNRLRELKIRVIAGLVHHGSGPRHTSLVSPCFPEKLAKYAAAVAARFPWIDAYTPVNEPLTTARFSGLYGFWYPHGRDDRTFARAVVAQCRATVLAMQAIRRVNPSAQLIQTEDLGKTYSTPALSYQADLENARRLLAFDLLCGTVNKNHKLWQYLLKSGITEAEILWFEENPCPPDVMGFNHYLTSERFLDENFERYPNCAVGENGRHKYADLEAVRVNLEQETGLRPLLKEIWNRYRLPLALTEIHLGCTREEQLRWFAECWTTAEDLRDENIDIRAVTAWSLLGSFDWNSLVTKQKNHYESGVYDLRGNYPRPTALTGLLKSISQGKKFEHPVLENPGWWKRGDRFLCKDAEPNESAKVKSIANNSARQLLITGSTGTLGRAFARICDVRGISYKLLSRREMDIADIDSVRRALERYNAWAVVNSAGYVRVDAAEDEQEACFRENTLGAANLAEVCEHKGISFLTFSSDLVFDGNNSRAYIESDAPAPINIYGKSKAEAEERVLRLNPNSLIIRTSAFFGPWDNYNFLRIALQTLRAGKDFVAADDSLISPTYIPDLVNTSLDLLIDRENGIWHLAQKGAITWANFARWAAELAKLDSKLVVGCKTKELNLPAPRPLFSVLGSERGVLMPTLENSLVRFIEHYNSCPEN
ncbi:MAG TPA: family 1 glycosylhydrolase [Pyrinomonadaceae bacterium]|jgi:dTDP-4-dehydrorhamnose reductase